MTVEKLIRKTNYVAGYGPLTPIGSHAVIDTNPLLTYEHKGASQGNNKRRERMHLTAQNVRKSVQDPTPASPFFLNYSSKCSRFNPIRGYFSSTHRVAAHAWQQNRPGKFFVETCHASDTILGTAEIKICARNSLCTSANTRMVIQSTRKFPTSIFQGQTNILSVVCSCCCFAVESI